MEDSVATAGAGSRFNGPERGAWYAALEPDTARAKVAFHKSQELQEINWHDRESFTFDDYLADFRTDFHDIRGNTAYADSLDPKSYVASQRLAGELLASGSAGIAYPSVRRAKGTCLVCFRPALVTNVRKGQSLTITFHDAMPIR